MSNKTFAVATKAIVYRDKIFLVVFKSDKEDVNPNSYYIPGGRIDFNEELDDALKREVKEESGLEIEIIQPTDAWSFLKDEDTQLTGITYLVIGQKGEVVLSEEHSSYEWLTYDEVLKRADELPEWLVNSIKTAQKLLRAHDIV
jgi:8-oxo-dGTP diphosphatase